MKEVELKVLNIDKDNLVQKLEALGAKLVYQGLMRIKYFDFPDQRIKKARELCRVRDLGDFRIEIVYKDNERIEGGCKVYDELETLLHKQKAAITPQHSQDTVDDYTTLCQFLHKLGLKEWLYYEKKRWNYAYDGLHFEIDQHPKIPVYVEIEGTSFEDVHRGIQLLALHEYETSYLTTSELFHQKYPHIQLNGLRF